MQVEERAEKVQHAIQEVYRDEDGGLIVSKWVAMVETVDGEGEKSLHRLAGPLSHIATWERDGMLHTGLYDMDGE